MLNSKINTIVMIILSLMICVSLSACSSAKSDKKVIDDVLAYDTYYSSFDLEITESEITKRQTNDSEKTDFAWLSIKAENNDFIYSSDYMVTYIKYNDGWHMEQCDTLNSSYDAKNITDYSIVENYLKNEYDCYELIDKSQDGNDAHFTYSVESTEGYLITQCTVTLDYSFSPESSWTLKDANESNAISKLNIVGEWMFADEYKREYYIHVSDTSPNDITANYYFIDPNDSSIEDESTGYEVLKITKDTSSSYYFEAGTNRLHFYINNIGKNNGFFYNDFQLVRQNESETPIVDRKEAVSKLIQDDFKNKVTIAEGYINIKEWDSAFQTIITISTPPDALVSKIDCIYENLIQHYYDCGEIQNVEYCLEKIHNKSEQISSIESAVKAFNEDYGKWLGEWVYDPNSEDFDYRNDLKITVGNKDGKLILYVKDGFLSFECCKATDTSLVYLKYETYYYVLKWKSDSEIAYCSFTHDINDIDDKKELFTLYKK